MSGEGLEIFKVKVEGVLERILERMDDHDTMEEKKRIERLEEKRVRKSNFITIIIAVLGLFVSASIFLNNFTHKTDLRLQKIEGALGIREVKR